MYFISILLIIKLLWMNVETMQRGDFISITEAPYYASLITPDKTIYCGAAIVSEYWLISAGHCVEYGYGSTKVRTGASVGNGNGSIRTIDHVVIPDNYSYYTSPFRNTYISVNDISLIKLKEPIAFDEYQQPIKLRSRPAKVNDTVTIIGLGNERVSQLTPSLKKMSQLVAATGPPFGHKPPSVFHLQNSTSHICPGDSGSPGVIDNELAGIVSFVDEKCKDWYASHQTKYPGALTRIDMFYNWILNHTEIQN